MITMEETVAEDGTASVTEPVEMSAAEKRRAQVLDDYPAAALKRTELRAPVGPTTKKQLEKATRDYGMEMTCTKVRNARILATQLEPQQVEAILNEQKQFKKCKKRPALQGDAPADVCMTPVSGKRLREKTTIIQSPPSDSFAKLSGNPDTAKPKEKEVKPGKGWGRSGKKANGVAEPKVKTKAETKAKKAAEGLPRGGAPPSKSRSQKLHPFPKGGKKKKGGAALKMSIAKKLRRHQKTEKKKREEIEANNLKAIKFKLMEHLAAEELFNDVPVESHDDVLVDSDAEAAMRRQDEEEILHLKHLDAVERRADEISAHKAQLQRRRQPEGHARLEFDFADTYWDSPPPGRLMWCDD